MNIGMKLTIGSDSCTPKRPRAAALLEHEHHDAVCRADREQVHHRGLDRHEDRAEHDHQQDERQADDSTR